MSLATNVRMHVGHEQADDAALEADGVFYRCYVWLSRVTWTIEATVKRVQPNGTEVEIFSNVIARASQQEIDDTNGLPLDSPKIIASGTTFVVHWLQASDVVDLPPVVRAWALHRATMDMAAFDITSWDDRGQVSLLESHALYDVAIVEGHDRDFVVARLVDVDDILVQRFDGFDWSDTVWTSSPGTHDVAPRVLGVYANDDDDDCVVAYQRDATGQLWSIRIDAEDAGNEAGPVIVFNDFPATFGESPSLTQWVQVDIARAPSATARRAVICAEAQAAINEVGSSDVIGQGWIHHVCSREINSSSSARVGNEHWVAGFSMASRLWAYNRHLYVMLTWRSAIPALEWSQAYAFACDLDYARWQAVASGAGLRPRPIVTITGDSIGIPDARTSGWHPEGYAGADVHIGGPTKRMNHLPHASAAPPFGPDVKTRTIAMPFFSAIRSTSDLGDTDDDGNFDDAVSNTAPEGAGIVGLHVYMEDPRTVYRDASDPDQPVENFAFPYSRTMHQCVPWGRSLFVAGGTPQLYDGSAMVEAGFLHKPEAIDWSTDTGGDMEVGGAGETRSYYWCFYWIDKLGQEHLSGRSEIVTIEFGTDTAVRFAVRCMTASLKDATAFYPLAQSIQILMFRTELNGATYHRCYGKTDTGGVVDQRPRDTPVNDPETLLGYVFIDDGVSDAELVLQGLGPFQTDANGVWIEPIPQTIPAMHSVTLHSGRIVGSDSLAPTRLVYSDENAQVGSANFSAPVFGANQFFFTGETEETTGLQSKGSSLFQFTRSRIFQLNASNAGFGLLSWQSQLMHDALGCVEPRSVVVYPLGLGFQSPKGYHLFASSGEIGYGNLARSRDQPQSKAGAAIEDDLREAGNVCAAAHDPSRQRISLFCNGAPTQTQTWALEITVDGITGGVWSIAGLAQTPIFVATALHDESDVASGLEAFINTLIAADPPNTLRYEVASVQNIGGGVLLLELLPNLERTLTGDGPGAGTIDASVTTELETNPWVLDYYYDFDQWTRAELVQTNASTRYSEVMDGCYWQAEGGARQVVLAQGGVLLQRLPTDDFAYADETSTGLVGIPLDITFNWVHFGGLVGWACTWEIVVQTERIDDDLIFATLEYDREGYFDGQQIPATDYEWPRPGETRTPPDLRIKPRFQRMRSNRLRVYEVNPSITENVRIVGLVFHVGVLPGPAKSRNAQRGAA